MQVLSVRCGMTKNLGNYESAKVEVEAAPSDGQTADELLAEVKSYLEKQIGDAGAPTAAKEPAKKNSSPLASGDGAKAKPSKAAAQAAMAKPAVEQAVEVGEPGDSEPAPKKRGRPPKKPAANPAELLKSTLAAGSLKELLDNFVQLRMAVTDDFDADKWESAVDRIEDVYRRLQQEDEGEVDTKVLSSLANGFTAERLRINKRRGADDIAA